jgi:Domain of unknown function (DUF4292)
MNTTRRFYRTWIAVAAVVCLVLTLSCRGSKKIQTAINNVDSSQVVKMDHPEVDSAALKAGILAKVNQQRIDFNTFFAKIKVDYTDNSGKKTNATAFVRVRKDSLMWVSLTGPLGIEGFRALISPDSVLVMNKLEKTLSRRSVNYLQDIIKLPIDFYVLQDIIMGNPVFFAENIVSFKYAGPSLMALSVGSFFKHLVTIDTTSNQLIHSKLDDVDDLRNRTCDITLGGFQNQQGRSFSTMREITVTEKSKLDIVLEFKQFSFNEPQTFPFNVPKNYILK